MIMKKPDPITLTVINSRVLTANMQRITLHNEALANFPDDCAGGYIKLIFNEQGGTDLSPVINGQKPTLRTYTIAQYNPEQLTIDVDFVRHEVSDPNSGFAARWAINAKVDDTISIMGPSLLADINTNTDWYFTVADMTALPALSAKLKKLPAQAQGYAVIQVISESDIREIELPGTMQLIWITEQQSLADKVRALPWLAGNVAVWVACEFDSMKALRRYFRNEKAVERDNIYISSYWKKGLTEDGHKVVKRDDPDRIK